ncbi:MAG TPA: hypothetical protein VLM40_11810 [Gemmata sp.]|nr:hypothetical protein [Gemmata sp.]
MPQPPEDPTFKITYPPPGSQVLTTFSVYGTCTAINRTSPPTITVQIGNSPAVIAMLDLDAGTWQAILTAPSTGPNQTVKANCNQGGGDQTVSVNVVSPTGSYSVNEPTPSPPPPPSPPPAGDVGSNPWNDLSVGGKYTVGTISAIYLYAFKKGNQLFHTMNSANLDGNGNWTFDLGKFPMGPFEGEGFCVLVGGVSGESSVLGSIPSFMSIEHQGTSKRSSTN